MSAAVINRSPDLQRLQNEGYEVEVRSAYLLVHSVPYVKAKEEIGYGTLVSSLDLALKTVKPQDHKVWFTGEQPCKRDGTSLEGIHLNADRKDLGADIIVNHEFSNKPKDGYPDYFSKMTRYIEILSAPARSINPAVTAQTYKVIKPRQEQSVFHYEDSASSRAGIAALAPKLAMKKIAIIGLGGTGSYVFDQIAKTHVEEIHLFDGKKFLQHNAFRAPGAASAEEIEAQPYKVSYYAAIYRKMRKGIIEHPYFINDENIDELEVFDFIFICVDKPSVRKLISEKLAACRIPFIDVGMDVEYIDETKSLIGCCRTTLVTEKKSDHFGRRVSLKDSPEDGLYDSNIQIADLNALNAIMAVFKWKKYCTFYQDLANEHDSVYCINVHQLTRDETP